MVSTNHYIVILCGGTGPRLWPLSRTDNPKQFLSILSDKSLLNQTISRCQKIVPSSHIFLITNQKYFSKTRRLVNKKISTVNIISEPQKKNTTMAIVYAATFIQKLNPRAIISFLPSDHFVRNPAEFKNVLTAAAVLALKHQKIVLLGSLPTFPNPSYGYIHTNKNDKQYAPAYSVLVFVEKPNLQLATKLIKNGYLWNLGIYTFSASVLFAELAKHQPLYFSLYQKLQKHLNNPRLVNQVYNLSPALAIDYALAEKSKELLALPVNFIWSDVGEWKTIYQQSVLDPNGFAKIDNHTNFAQFDSQNCLLSAPKNKLIGLVGVKDLTIIDTSDALLICKTSQSLHVRNLISKIVSNKKFKHFFVAKNDH